MIADHNPIQPAPGLRTASDPGLSKAVAKQTENPKFEFEK